MAGSNDQRPLKNMAEAFQDLANAVNSLAPGAHIEAKRFARTCLLVSPLLGLLGTRFMFVKMEFDNKARSIDEGSRSIGTLQEMIRRDIEADSGTKIGSRTRNLLLLKRGLDMLRVLFENVIPMEGTSSLEGPARTAYTQVFGPYHPVAIRNLVSGGMSRLLTKDQYTKNINEDEISARTQMESYNVSATPVIQYVENLLDSYGLDLHS